MREELITAWRINQMILLGLIDAISAEGMASTLSTRGGRNVARQLAHIQYVRVHQLKSRAKTLAEGARLFDPKESPSKNDLKAALKDSSTRVEEWISRMGEPGFRSMKGGPATTLAYLVSHESHHRGSILLTLKQCGQSIDAKAAMALWGDWGKST
jgi:uncharacterized damage-inducible protein DinB